MTADRLIAVARRGLFIRETEGPNRGVFVEAIQHFCGGVPGSSWCAYVISLVLWIAYRSRPPLKRTGSCAEMLAECRAKGFVVTTPRPGDLVFSVDDNGHAHHVGLVTNTAPLVSVAGNTSQDGLSSDGTGMFEHEISPLRKAFARMPEAMA